MWGDVTHLLRLQKNDAGSTTTTGPRRSPTQCRVMTLDIITLYITLISQFFTLSSSTHSPSVPLHPSEDQDPIIPLPPFVPVDSNTATMGLWLVKTLNELTECVTEMGTLELPEEASGGLKEMVASTRWRFEEAVCAAWVRGTLHPTLFMADIDETP
jgi:exocyst complex component 2